jgi:DHA2 family multidrug resistance protein
MATIARPALGAPTPTPVVEYGLRRILVVGAVMLGALLQLADTTIVNVSLPTIDGNLGATIDEGTWFITAYIITNVVMIPLSPWFQTRLGRKRFFALCLGGFTASSILCGSAGTVGGEIFWRLLQGAFGGGLMVPAQQIIRDTFPPEQLGTSQTLFGLAATLGPTIGPTLGGLLTDAFSWRSIFFINVLPGIVATVLVVMVVRDAEAPHRLPVDAVGIGLLAVTLGSLQYVLEEGERHDWLESDPIRGFASLFLVGMVAFVLRELFGTTAPALALRVLRVRAVWATSVVNFAFGYCLYAMFVIQPLFTQSLLGYTTTLSGLMVMLRASAVLAMFPLVGRLVSRPDLDLRVVVSLGLATYAAASWFQANVVTTTTDFGALVPTQILGGIGLSLIFVPLNVALLRAIEPRIVPASLGLTRLAQQIGGSVATATIVTFIDRAFAVHDSELRAAATISRDAVRTLVAQPHGLLELATLVYRQSDVLAFADATRLMALIAAVSIPLPFLLARAQRAAR